MSKTENFGENLPNLHQEKLEELKKLLPNLFDRDGNLIKSELENFTKQYAQEKQEPFVFSWAGKQKAKSLAFRQNEIKLSLKFDEKRSKDFKKTQNLIIEGDNLHALKLLLPSYKGKVKCIYIDPPYNTQNDFIYPDNFAESEKEYLLNSGQIDIDGNLIINDRAETVGRKHSTWLSMIYPRLVLARELLREDGVIFVSIDDNEVHHLRHLMNEVFGEENFISSFAIKTPNQTEDSFRLKNLDHLLCYAKDVNSAKFTFEEKEQSARCTTGNELQTKPEIEFPANIEVCGVEDGIYENPRATGGNEDIEIISGRLVVKNSKLAESVTLKARWSNPNDIKALCEKVKTNSKQKIFNKFGKELTRIWLKGDRFQPQIDKIGFDLPESIWTEFSKKGGDVLRNLLPKAEFDYPKHPDFVRNILKISTSPNDIILDFFAGSGTTGQAVMELNQEEIDKKAKDGLLSDDKKEAGGRQFILIQAGRGSEKIAKIDEKKEAFKAGFRYIFDITVERIRRAAEKYRSVDNGFKVMTITESAIKRKLMNQITASKEEIFAEVALSYGYGLNYQLRELHNLGKGVFYLSGNEREALIILGQEQLNNETLKEIILASDGLSHCQIFAQDAVLNVEIIHNLYQHFEQRRVIIL